jgi:hypothetical protein
LSFSSLSFDYQNPQIIPSVVVVVVDDDNDDDNKRWDDDGGYREVWETKNDIGETAEQTSNGRKEKTQQHRGFGSHNKWKMIFASYK